MRLARALPAAPVVLGVFSACDSEEPEEPAPCAPGTAQIVVNECVFGITLDSDSADVVARFGPPDEYRRDREGFGFCFYRYDDHPEAGDVSVDLTRKGLFAIHISDSPLRTASGVGTHRAEARRLLGSPISPTNGPDESQYDFYGSEVDSVGTSFRFESTGGVSTLRGVSLLSLRQFPAPTRTPRSSPMSRP